MLSCSCVYDESSWYYYPPEDFVTLSLLKTSKRKRCCSCGELINIDSVCLEFGRYRNVRTDIEERIWGYEVGLAAWYMCEQCGEICLNLNALGYCIFLGDDMRKLLTEYQELTGFKKSD